MKQDLDSLAPSRDFSRRDFVRTTVGSDCALSSGFTRSLAVTST